MTKEQIAKAAALRSKIHSINLAINRFRAVSVNSDDSEVIVLEIATGKSAADIKRQTLEIAINAKDKLQKELETLLLNSTPILPTANR